MKDYQLVAQLALPIYLALQSGGPDYAAAECRERAITQAIALLDEARARVGPGDVDLRPGDAEARTVFATVREVPSWDR